MTVYIGTSGFTYHHWIKEFYPDEIKHRNWLEYYAKHFDTVEINSSFYHLTDEKTFQSWYERTPPNFVFTIKGSRYITHTKRLLVAQESVDLFMQRASKLKSKLKVVLWQLPPSFRSDSKRLDNFLKLFKNYDYQVAFEFRHESWFNAEIYEVLKQHNAALVLSNSPDFPEKMVQTADFSYIRFHGGKDLYSSYYSSEEMNEWAKRIKKLSDARDVFAYFNNDANAFAVKNALEIKNLLE